MTPLMLTPSSESRNVIEAAICSAVAIVGICAWKGFSRAAPASETFGGKAMPVATPRGATALTRMPCGPYMKAADRVRPTTPCLETRSEERRVGKECEGGGWAGDECSAGSE